jgi:Rieske Fe-S protein
MLAGVFATLGLTPEEAEALPVRWSDALGDDQGEATYPLPPADGATIDSARKVILVRLQGRVFALKVACPHMGGEIEWRSSDARFKCKRHGSEFQPDGALITGRAKRNMDRLPIRLNGSSVVVGLRASIRADKDKPAWDAAVVIL